MLKQLLAGLLLLPAAASAQTTFDKAIEREIRKHDAWVEGYVQQSNKDQAFVKIRTVPEYQQEAVEASGIIGATASYDPVEDTLFLPEPQSEEEEHETIDAVDHELWHTLFDDNGKKGIIFRRGYSGPDKKEIATYCDRKTRGPDFAELEKGLTLKIKSEEIASAAVGIASRYKLELEQVAETWRDINEELRANKDVLKQPQNQTDVVDKLKDAHKRLKSLRDVYLEFHGWLESLANEGTYDIESADECLSEYKKRLEVYQGVSQELGGLKQYLLNIYDTAEDKLLREDFYLLADELEQQTCEEERKILLDKIEGLRSTEKLVIAMRKQRKILEQLGALRISFSGELTGTMTNLVGATNAYKIRQIIHDPNEVMARILDSLYSLYYGPVTQDKFPLTEEDLHFLNRFGYKGRKLFRKGVEKYSIGKSMIESGALPEEVKAQLEYATAFKFKAVVYRWPESNFIIKGVIPPEAD